MKRANTRTKLKLQIDTVRVLQSVEHVSGGYIGIGIGPIVGSKGCTGVAPSVVAGAACIATGGGTAGGASTTGGGSFCTTGIASA